MRQAKAHGILGVNGFAMRLWSEMGEAIRASVQRLCTVDSQYTFPKSPAVRIALAIFLHSLQPSQAFQKSEISCEFENDQSTTTNNNN